ncbi:hypothetical protein CAPTEDRAFT_215883 [Capitella teleta]|uniref:Uncharacterized protein n=1 Tax=Capitella teleta TaxID=283909 RepID=R7V9R4_CAPTE|nr:hypothetical protein CAPTEDRAFT_215883 [Capitella teleta]|eukprot:ELU15329.1 hypothetical protein CAPTEDRAFT_215883 [Capitella teleta]
MAENKSELKYEELRNEMLFELPEHWMRLTFIAEGDRVYAWSKLSKEFKKHFQMGNTSSYTPTTRESSRYMRQHMNAMLRFITLPFTDPLQEQGSKAGLRRVTRWNPELSTPPVNATDDPAQKYDTSGTFSYSRVLVLYPRRALNGGWLRRKTAKVLKNAKS